MSDEKRSVGILSSLAGAIPAVPVDCSRWPRDPAAPRSRGKLVRVGRASPAPRLAHREDAGAPQPRCLELVVAFAPNLPPTQVWLEINRLLQAMSAAAPDLELTYDALRSRTENGNVIIALTPADPAGASERLGVLSDALRMSVGNFVQVRGIHFAA